MWKSEQEKLDKSKRKYVPVSYRDAELFCEECGVSLGVHDIVYTNLESMIYCGKCAKKYIKETPIVLSCGKVKDDFGTFVTLEYTDNYYESLTVSKTCYFNKKGRYIKVKGKRYYI